jgi:hypothetical protein
MTGRRAAVRDAVRGAALELAWVRRIGSRLGLVARPHRPGGASRLVRSGWRPGGGAAGRRRTGWAGVPPTS